MPTALAVAALLGSGLVACGDSDAALGAEGSDTAASAGDTMVDGTTGSGATGSATSQTSTPSSTGTTGGASSTGAALDPAVEIVALELAQSHVLPPEGRQWPRAEGPPLALATVAGRDALALVRLPPDAPSDLRLEVLVAGTARAELPLAPPAELPPTEDGGPDDADDLHSATIAAADVLPGLAVRVVGDGREPSAEVAVTVTADADVVVESLPLYLFGADETTLPLATIAAPSPAEAAEYAQKHPFARLTVEPHPAGRLQWPYVIDPPRAGAPARRMQSADELPDTGPCAQLGAALHVLGRLRAANGDGPTHRLSYGPVVLRNADGSARGPSGGCGGGSAGVGTTNYSGIFIHEMGHAFGLGHAGGEFDAGVYPYPGGSLEGSSWGYDANVGEFLAPWVPPTADSADDCASNPDRRVAPDGRCIKQDPMQSGHGDQRDGAYFTMFADVNAARLLRDVVGITTLDDAGQRVFEGGRIFVDPTFASGYARWDELAGRRVELVPATEDAGLYGFDMGLPITREVPVHAIVVTVSAAGTADATQIYPPLSFRGNLLRTVDPSDPGQRALIAPDGDEANWYCMDGGCDYTVRTTDAEGVVRLTLLRGGFRPWFGPTEPPEPAALDPLDPASFKVWAIHVPGDVALTRIELLATPRAWEGLPEQPEVLARRDL